MQTNRNKVRVVIDDSHPELVSVTLSTSLPVPNQVRDDGSDPLLSRIRQLPDCRVTENTPFVFCKHPSPLRSVAGIVLFFFLAARLAAQPSPPPLEGSGEAFFQWGLQAGGPGNDLVTGIVSVKSDLFVTGSFSGDFQCGGQQVSGYGSYDMYLMKTNKNGKPGWIQALGGEKADYGSCLAAGQDQLCMGGTAYGTIKLGEEVFEGEGAALIVTSWRLDGKLNWLARLPYTGQATIDVLQLFPDGSVMAGGMLQGTLSAGAGELKSPNRKLAWQAWLSSSGQTEKATLTSGKGSHRLVAASPDGQGNLYLLYSVNGSMDPEEGTSLTPQPGSKAALILQKQDTEGQFLWGQVIESTGYLEDAGLATGLEGEALVGLNFNKELHIGDTLITCESQLKTVLVNIRPDGEINWLQTISGPVNNRAMGVLANRAGGMLVTGLFREAFTTGGLVFESGESNSNLFLVQFDRNGKPVWYDAPAQDATNFSTAFTLDEQGNIILAGGFREKITLQGSPMKTLGGKDIFLAKYFNCNQQEVRITGGEPLCEGETRTLRATPGFEVYLWNGAGKSSRDLEVDRPGTYWVTAYTKQGCMAADTLELVMADTQSLGLEPLVTLYPGNIKTLAANEGFISYEWSDGLLDRQRELHYSEGAAEELLVLTAQTAEGCLVADSVTVRFSESSNKDSPFANGLKVHPNPVTDILWWSVEAGLTAPLEITLTDSKSARVYRETIRDYIPNSQRFINMGGYVPGNFVLTVRSGDLVFTEKIIKK